MDYSVVPPIIRTWKLRMLDYCRRCGQSWGQ